MFCSNCGGEIKEGEKFCGNCGCNASGNAGGQAQQVVYMPNTTPQMSGATIASVIITIGVAIFAIVAFCVKSFGLEEHTILGDAVSLSPMMIVTGDNPVYETFSKIMKIQYIFWIFALCYFVGMIMIVKNLIQELVKPEYASRPANIIYDLAYSLKFIMFFFWGLLLYYALICGIIGDKDCELINFSAKAFAVIFTVMRYGFKYILGGIFDKYSVVEQDKWACSRCKRANDGSISKCKCGKKKKIVTAVDSYPYHY